MKNILFLVTGMTPQIITETLYALAVAADEPWLPHEVHVMSTKDGLTQIRATLFEQGIFQRLCDDYDLKGIVFNEANLYCIKDADGNDVNDLKTLTHNTHAANMICDKIQQFTDDENTSLHVSIAGGRKTMGFYAGYALSLYGRYQDRMSHVLVDERFENVSDFYYPAKTPDSMYVTKRVNGKDTKLDAYDATVWLADIAFVRLRKSLSKETRISKVSFSTVIDNINRAMKDIQITCDLKSHRLYVNDKAVQGISPRAFAFYYCFLQNAKVQGEGLKRPTNKVGVDDAFQASFDSVYAGKTEDAFISYQLFDEAKSELKTLFIDNLGVDMAYKLLPEQAGRGKPYKLNISADSIEILKV